MFRDIVKRFLSHNSHNKFSSDQNICTRESWDNQYSGGQWDYLRSIDELGHYSLIVGYCQFLCPKASILDIGCGQGLLQQRLSYLPYKQYVGLDVSEVAISKARAHIDERTNFLVADANKYESPNKMDIIIFNETLYYFSDVKKTLEHYSAMLDDGGYFIISMFDQDESNLCWSKIDDVYDVVDATAVTNQSSLTWNCKVVKNSIEKSLH